MNKNVAHDNNWNIFLVVISDIRSKMLFLCVYQAIPIKLSQCSNSAQSLQIHSMFNIFMDTLLSSYCNYVTIISTHSKSEILIRHLMLSVWNNYLVPKHQCDGHSDAQI